MREVAQYRPALGSAQAPCCRRTQPHGSLPSRTPCTSRGSAAGAMCVSWASMDTSWPAGAPPLMTARMSRAASFDVAASAVRVRDKAKASGSGAPWSIAALRARESPAISVGVDGVPSRCLLHGRRRPGLLENLGTPMPAVAVGSSGIAPSNVEVLMAPSRIAIEVVSSEGGAAGCCTADDWSSASAEELALAPEQAARPELAAVALLILRTHRPGHLLAPSRPTLRDRDRGPARRAIAGRRHLGEQIGKTRRCARIGRWRASVPPRPGARRPVHAEPADKSARAHFRPPPSTSST